MFPLWVWGLILLVLSLIGYLLTFKRFVGLTQGSDDERFSKTATPQQEQKLDRLGWHFTSCLFAGVFGLFIFILGLLLRFLFGIDIA